MAELNYACEWRKKSADAQHTNIFARIAARCRTCGGQGHPICSKMRRINKETRSLRVANSCNSNRWLQTA
eukprot:4206172-Amphidinium_carterae.1